ncbi:MAG: hypothetical protein Q7V14_01825, partial [Coriobacteriia bacterium]|nr:hypothetical protein [Coriobacteriia bacterium]
DMRRDKVPVRPRLRLVKEPATAPKPRTESRARNDQRYREVFNLACVVMIGLTLFGLGQVMLSARAAETAMEAGRLVSDIKVQRLAGELLEVDKSTLATPSRIEGIAGESLKMTAAPAAEYMTLPAAVVAPKSVRAPNPVVGGETRVSWADIGSGGSGGLAGMLASVMQMAAGEAEILLVGDAGLASAR